MNRTTTFQGVLAMLIVALSFVGPVHGQATTGERFSDEFLPTWQRAAAYTLAMAEAMPAEQYDFRPTPEVRTFAEQMLHLAQIATGVIQAIHDKERPYSADGYEAEGKSKDQVLAILNRSFEYVEEAIRTMSAAQEQQDFELFNGALSFPSGKHLVLFVRDHMTHHRGQTVIYLRMQGIEPPPFLDYY